MILRTNVLHPTAPAMQTITHPDLLRVGDAKLAVYPIHKVVAYMYDSDGVMCLDDIDNIEGDPEMDNLADPDLYNDDDDEEEGGTPAEYLQQQRDFLLSLQNTRAATAE